MDPISELVRDALDGQMNRRQLVERGLALGLSMPVVAGVLAACGGGDDDDETATSASGESTTTGGAATTSAATGTPAMDASPGATQGTGTSGGASTGKPIDKVTVLLSGGVRFLDPTIRPSTTDAQAPMNIYDTLVRMDKETWEPIPGLATSWETINDTTWQFKLREGVKFHNGEDFNADSVVAWFKRLQDVEAAGEASSLQQIESVTGVEKVDDFTVNFITSEPDPILPRRLFIYYMLITPARPYEEEGPDALMTKPIGTGPYIFKEWVKDDHITLEANEDYWDGAPLVKTLEFRPVIEGSSRAAAVLTGEADIDTSLSLGSIDQFKNSDDVEVRSVLSATTVTWCQLNAAKSEYFKDVRVRQAVNYAVDKAAIIDSVLGGFAVENANIVAKQAFGYKEIPPYPYDPDKAKSLLEEAGYGDGFSIVFQFYTGGENKEVVQAISGFLGDVGIKTEIEEYTLADLLGLWQNHNVKDMVLLGKSQFAVDADYIFQELQPDKLFGWLFPLEGEIQEVYQQEHRELDPEKRKELAAQIQQYYYDQAGMLFLWQPEIVCGVSKKVVWTPRIDALVLGTEMSAAE